MIPSMLGRGYLGLRNEGSTCYLNSILECLFMTPEFTNSILSERDVIVNADRTVKKVQKLFIDLRFGNSTPSTRKLMNSLGIESGKQQDVEEYFRFLLNSIPEKMEAQKLFHIQVVHSITCEKCNTKDVIPYTWLSLPVSIKEENPSVQAAIDSFLKKLRFEGENRCYCENCGSKQDSISRNYFISLPRVLVIHLKRYEIYRGHFQKKFTAVSVENSLKIPLKKGADHAEYELFALCHHFGGLTGGHYTSEIKSSEDNQWYSFNDSNVMVVPPRETKKSETAYLLMYRKKQEDIPKFLEKDDLPKHVKFWIDELLKTSGSKGHKEFS
ncbi:ubiquitin carboxyl-terminal hydrolase 50-like isoform X2 [Pleurodeles waltl]|uniref:ubiquitin carboxyl-terminal hydrolase 50-like isoform X2 n=1 Tax=Pleurodeles waltl TaxID=8319 RepID=UPI003709506C